MESKEPQRIAPDPSGKLAPVHGQVYGSNEPAQNAIITRPIILGDLTLASPTTQTTVGSAGGASALPATPTGYFTVMVGNTPFIVPYYAVS